MMRIACRSIRVLTGAAFVFVLSCGGGKEAEPPPAEPTGRPARTLPIPSMGEDQPSGALPQGHPPADSRAAAVTPPPPGSGSGAAGLAWKVPAAWVEESPSSPMRKAQYRVPAPTGDGECAVFYFGPGQGGDPMSNALRWAGQFKQPDGRPSSDVMKVSNVDIGGIAVHEVEVTGTFTGGMTTTMEPALDKPNSMLLGAIAQGPDANWFFKFTGPEATVGAQRAAFQGMIRSLKTGS